MLVVLVEVQVKPEAVAAFRQATFENARMSLTEPGIARFDVLERHGDVSSFVLVEVYRDEAAPALHKQTAHYAAWRDAVEPMLAAPRTSSRFHGAFPGQAGWDAADKG